MSYKPLLMTTPFGSGTVPSRHSRTSGAESQLRHLLCDVLGRSEGFFHGLISEFNSMPDDMRARATRSAIEFYSQRTQ